MSYQTTIQTSQLLAPLQEGVMNLRKHFPEWKEVERLREDITAIERRLITISPRLLNLLGKGAMFRKEEERAQIQERLNEKYS